MGIYGSGANTAYYTQCVNRRLARYPERDTACDQGVKDRRFQKLRYDVMVCNVR